MDHLTGIQNTCQLRGLIILLVLSGCAAAPISTDGGDAAYEIPVVSSGMVDVFNRYPSTVRVLARVAVPREGLANQNCSGLLVSDRVVLTAGHCVCHPRKSGSKGEYIIDRRSQCAGTADILVLQYKPRPGLVGEVKDFADVVKNWSKVYTGTVEPHEGIKIVYSQMTVGKTPKTVRSTKESSADLAAILLRESLEGEPAYGGHAGSALPWKDGQFEINDEVAVVGFGADGGWEPAGEQRRYGSNNIIAVKSDETAFTIGQQSVVEPIYDGEGPSLARPLASYALPGDSGGPCYLEKNGMVIGIVKSITDGEFMLSSCTNLRPYLEWVRAKIAKADVD